MERITFAPQSTPIAPNFRGVESLAVETKSEQKENGNTLLLGSLAALGAFGVGLLIRKPKTVEKVVTQTAETTVKKAEEEAAKVKKAVKSKRKTRKQLDTAGKDIRMDKSDAKWQRKRERQIIENQRRIEAEEAITEQELQAYQRENGYQAPTAEQKHYIDALNSANAQERAEKNTIENCAKITKTSEVTAPKATEQEKQIKSLEGTIASLRARISGAKKFGKDTSKLEAQLKSLEEKLENLSKEGK